MMSDSVKIKNSIETVGKLVKTVIADIQARPDYSGSGQLKAMVSQLRTFSQHVLNNETNGTAQTYQELRAEALQRIVPEVHKLMDANIEMAGLGQLNTARKVQPSVLQSQNKTLQTLLNALEMMIALIGVPSSTSQSSGTGAHPSGTEAAGKPEPAIPSADVMAPAPPDQRFTGTVSFDGVMPFKEIEQSVSASLMSHQ